MSEPDRLELMSKTLQDKTNEFFGQFPSKTYKKGGILLEAGKNPSHIFFLKSGYVQQTAISHQGESITIHLYEKGSFFPLSFVLNQTLNTYYFEALTNCEAYLCPIDKIIPFLEKNPDILFDLTKRAFLGISGLSKRIESVTFGNAKARVVSILLYLSQHFGKEEGEVVKIEQRFTHQEIASLAGLTRERVSLELEKLTKEEIISTNKHLITINNLGKLKDID